jgi:hypothetical protein
MEPAPALTDRQSYLTMDHFRSRTVKQKFNHLFLAVLD